MPELSSIATQVIDAVGHDTSDTGGTTITAGTSHTKGSYVQLIAATTEPADWIEIQLSPPSSSNKYLVDIALGGSGSEVVIFSDLVFEAYNTSYGNHHSYNFPFRIPAGVRISARCQCVGASQTMDVIVLLGSGPTSRSGSLQKMTSYGPDTSNTSLVSIDPGGTAHTKSSWVELTAATTSPIKWVCLAIVRDSITSGTTLRWLADLAIGAAGSEVVVMSNMLFTSGGFTSACHIASKPLVIPSGVRVAARVQCSSNSSPSRVADVALYGVG